MEKEKKDLGTDAFGRELPEKTPEEITRDIERILNYQLEQKEKPKLEEAVGSQPIINNAQKSPNSVQYHFSDLLKDIGRKHYVGSTFLTPSELSVKLLQLGTKKLGEKAGISLFRRQVIRNLDDLADDLYEWKVVSSVQDGKKVIGNLCILGHCNRVPDCDDKTIDYCRLRFQEVIGTNSQKALRIRKYSFID